EVPAGARNGVWESLPAPFRRLMRGIADVQAGRQYDRWWERLNQEEMGSLVREFVATINQMGDGEMGYMLLLRYLPEVLRRALQDDSKDEIQVHEPISLYLAERLGQAASEWNQPPSSEQAPTPGPPTAPGDSGQQKWLPSMTI